MNYILFILYILFSLLIAFLGRDRRLGFIWTLVFSLLFSPLVIGIGLLAFDRRNWR